MRLAMCAHWCECTHFPCGIRYVIAFRATIYAVRSLYPVTVNLTNEQQSESLYFSNENMRFPCGECVFRVLTRKKTNGKERETCNEA